MFVKEQQFPKYPNLSQHSPSCTFLPDLEVLFTESSLFVNQCTEHDTQICIQMQIPALI